ncbi:MAG: hypothetical protein AAB373_06760 [Patescibacteria group bacterium]
MKKFVSITAVLVTTIVLSACKSKGPEVSLESLLPENSMMVMGVNFADGEQKDNLMHILKQFPDVGLAEKIATAANDELQEEDLTFEDDIKPILTGGWDLAAAFVFEKGAAEPEVSIVVRIDESKKLERLMKDAGDATVGYSEEGDFDLWTDAETDLYMGNMDDYWFVTNTEEGRSAIMAKLESGEAKVNSLESKVAEVKDNLGYFYFDMANFGELLKADPSAADMPLEIFENFGAVTGSVSAEKDGFAFKSSADFSNADEEFVKLLGMGDKKLTLIDKINGIGTIIYGEQATFAIANVLLGYDVPVTNEVTGEKIAADRIKEEGAKFFGITPADFDDLLNSNIAFRMGYAGDNYIPEIGFFVDMKDINEDAVTKIVDTLNVYFEQMEAEFMAMAEQQPELKGALKKDIVNVMGGGVHRMYIDTAVIPAEIKAQMDMLGLKDPKIELNYGVTGDNVFVLALTPDFALGYGKGPLTDDADFKVAADKIGGVDGYAVSYVAVAPLVDLINDWVAVSEKTGVVPASVKADINLYVNGFMSTFKYLISSNTYEDDISKGVGFLKIEKVEMAEVEKGE